MTRTAAKKKSTKRAAIPSVFRPRDLEALGLPRSRLRAMLRKGEAEQIGRGLYRLRSTPVTERETIALVAKRMPRAIVCLLTALSVHEIGTQAPREVWIALDRKARKPAPQGLPVRTVRYSGRMLTYGIESREIQGVKVRITSPARTVVDCFRYRSKIGLDVALEALRDALRSRKATVDQILRAAEACRARTVIRPHLEAMSS